MFGSRPETVGLRLHPPDGTASLALVLPAQEGDEERQLAVLSPNETGWLDFEGFDRLQIIENIDFNRLILTYGAEEGNLPRTS